MAGEDQERFEDYLELERYIEELQAGRAAHPPKEMTPDQASIYRMAALFRSAAPEASEPHPEFAEQLKARLLAQEDHTPLKDVAEEPTRKTPVVSPAASSAAASISAASSVNNGKSNEHKKPIRFVSRRALLAGGAVAAVASFALGAGIERSLVEQPGASTGPSSDNDTPIPTAQGTTIGLEGPTTWMFVAKLAELGNNAVRFVSDGIIGYVIRDDTATSESSSVIAMSAACTHMGCIVQWQQDDRHFHCPCHDAIFTSQGNGVNHERYRYTLSPLPRLNTKIANGSIFVEVPAKK